MEDLIDSKTRVVLSALRMTDLITCPFADDASEVHPLPELVPALQELGEAGHPALAQRPREHLVFLVLLVLLHIVSQIPAVGTVEGVSETTPPTYPQASLGNIVMILQALWH